MTSRLGVGIALCLGLAVACSPRTRSASRGDDDTRAPRGDEKRLLEVDLTTGAPEAVAGGLFQLPATRTYTGLVRALERGLTEKSTAGVLVRFSGQDFELAQAEELAGLLGRYGKQGLPVVCHADGLSNSTAALVLRGCTRRWLGAAGAAETVGIAAQIVYLKGVLDRLKIQADFLHVGRFKSGPEPLTHEGPSPEARESLETTLASIREAWLALPGEVSPGVRQALELGPFSPQEAKAQGLVHELGFESDAMKDLQRLTKTNATEPVFGPRAGKSDGLDIGDVIRVIAGAGEGLGDQPHVAVVPMQGSITTEASGPFASGGIISKAMVKTLRRLARDGAVRAVVIRIDSPGGSPLASDLIWHELMELRRKKPVVASVGGMAASGGYYIAAGAQRIFAEPTSIVGSIGVFGGKIVLGPALSELGINSVTFPASPTPGAGDRAAYLSPLVPWDETMRERMRAVLQGIYDLFIERVATGRKMPPERVLASAEGRIWSARQGLERGLVDELGGLTHAIQAARKLSSLDAKAPVTVEGGADGLLELFGLEEGASEMQIRQAFERVMTRQERALGVLPPELRPFLDTIGPLLAGETVLAALPYSLTIR